MSPRFLCFQLQPAFHPLDHLIANKAIQDALELISIYSGLSEDRGMYVVFMHVRMAAQEFYDPTSPDAHGEAPYQPFTWTCSCSVGHVVGRGAEVMEGAGRAVGASCCADARAEIHHGVVPFRWIVLWNEFGSN